LRRENLKNKKKIPRRWIFLLQGIFDLWRREKEKDVLKAVRLSDSISEVITSEGKSMG
jgi:hypothetical protein